MRNLKTKTFYKNCISIMLILFTLLFSYMCIANVSAYSKTLNNEELRALEGHKDYITIETESGIIEEINRINNNYDTLRNMDSEANRIDVDKDILSIILSLETNNEFSEDFKLRSIKKLYEAISKDKQSKDNYYNYLESIYFRSLYNYIYYNGRDMSIEKHYLNALIFDIYPEILFLSDNTDEYKINQIEVLFNYNHDVNLMNLNYHILKENLTKKDMSAYYYLLEDIFYKKKIRHNFALNKIKESSINKELIEDIYEKQEKINYIFQKDKAIETNLDLDKNVNKFYQESKKFLRSKDYNISAERKNLESKIQTLELTKSSMDEKEYKNIIKTYKKALFIITLRKIITISVIAISFISIFSIYYYMYEVNIREEK